MNYTTLLRWQQSHHHQWSWVPMTLHNVNVVHRVDMYWKIQHTMTAYFSSIYFQVTLNLFTSYHSINHKLNINRLHKWTPNNLILVFRFQLLFPWGHCSKTEKKHIQFNRQLRLWPPWGVVSTRSLTSWTSWTSWMESFNYSEGFICPSLPAEGGEIRQDVCASGWYCVTIIDGIWPFKGCQQQV